MDLGHSAENVYLQAEALGLGTCAIAAFSDDKIIEVGTVKRRRTIVYHANRTLHDAKLIKQ